MGRCSFRRDQDENGGAVAWSSAACLFCLICGYTLLRPVRDALGVAWGPDRVPVLFTVTCIGSLLLVPLYGALVSWMAPTRVVPLSYAGLFVQLLLFPPFLRTFAWAPPAFFAWVSVFNLFGTALFWGLMADVFPKGAARRSFSRIAGAGSLGGLFGSALCARLAPLRGPIGMIPIAAFFLLGASVCSAGVVRGRGAGPGGLGGRAFDGILSAARSPRLLGLGALLSMQTLLSTFLYLEGARIASLRGVGVGRVTAIFASVDVAAGLLALPLQLLASGPLMEEAGLGVTLAALPASAFLGFVAIALFPVPSVVIGMTVLTRALNLALLRPAREVLFTTFGRQARYKAKSFVDTAVQRLGDASSSWLLVGLASRGLGLPSLALIGASVALGATWVAYRLGGGLETRVGARHDVEADGPEAPLRVRPRELRAAEERQF